MRRTLTAIVLTAALAPLAAHAQDREWEENYGDQWVEEPVPSSDYRVSVDMDTGGNAGVTMETFQGALSPYGSWVVVGGYGRVWRPSVPAGWRPYYYGRWEWTNEGWLWVSEEPFGWAAYHYGRWTYDGYYGWVWIPGHEWAPAWVSWRYSGDVVGWAPLGPGVSVYVATYPYVDTWWTFVPCATFVSGPVYRVAYPTTYTRRYFEQTAPAPPRAYPGRHGPGVPPAPRPAAGSPPAAPAWGGPPPRVIEARIGRPLTPVRVVTAPTPGPSRVSNGEVLMYRPSAQGGRPGAAPAPSADRSGGLVPEPRSAAPSRGPSPSFARPQQQGNPQPQHQPSPQQQHGWSASPGGRGAVPAGGHAETLERTPSRGAAPGGTVTPPSAPPRASPAPVRPSAPAGGGGGGGGSTRRAPQGRERR